MGMSDDDRNSNAPPSGLHPAVWITGLILVVAAILWLFNR
jgi:hypothetical protein